MPRETFIMCIGVKHMCTNRGEEAIRRYDYCELTYGPRAAGHSFIPWSSYSHRRRVQAITFQPLLR